MWEKLRKDTGKRKEKCRGTKLDSHLVYMHHYSALSSSPCYPVSTVTVLIAVSCDSEQ